MGATLRIVISTNENRFWKDNPIKTYQLCAQRSELCVSKHDCHLVHVASAILYGEAMNTTCRNAPQLSRLRCIWTPQRPNA